MEPITRTETYLAYLNGDTSTLLPEPITRTDYYLYSLCVKGGSGGGGSEYALVSEAGYSLVLDVNPTTYLMEIKLKNKAGSVLSSQNFDFPIETAFVNADYNKVTHEITFTLQNGTKTDPIDISDIVRGLVPDDRTIAGLDLKDDITAEELKTALEIDGLEDDVDTIKQSLSDIENKLELIGGRNLALDSEKEMATSASDSSIALSFIRKLSSYGKEILNEKGAKIVISFDARANVDGQEVASVLIDDSFKLKNKAEFIPLSTEYKRYHQSVCITEYGATKTGIQMNVAPNEDAGLVVVKNVKVELGETPTDYTQAPEDVGGGDALSNPMTKDLDMNGHKIYSDNMEIDFTGSAGTNAQHFELGLRKNGKNSEWLSRLVFTAPGAIKMYMPNEFNIIQTDDSGTIRKEFAFGGDNIELVNITANLRLRLHSNGSFIFEKLLENNGYIEMMSINASTGEIKIGQLNNSYIIRIRNGLFAIEDKYTKIKSLDGNAASFTSLDEIKIVAGAKNLDGNIPKDNDDKFIRMSSIKGLADDSGNKANISNFKRITLSQDNIVYDEDYKAKITNRIGLNDNINALYNSDDYMILASTFYNADYDENHVKGFTGNSIIVGYTGDIPKNGDGDIEYVHDLDNYTELRAGSLFAKQLYFYFNINGDRYYMGTSGFYSGSNSIKSLGTSSYKWKDIYASNSVIQTSDRNEKNSFEELTPDKAKLLILGLKPTTYKMDAGTSGRTHWGLISQDIEELLDELGWDSKDFAGFIKSPKVKVTNEDENGNPLKEPIEEVIEGEYDYSLRYDEFISPMIKVIQDQEKRINNLESEVTELKKMVQQVLGA